MMANFKKGGAATAKGKYQEWLSADGLLRLEGYARDGLSDEQIAANMGIGTTTYYRWQQEYKEIREAIKKGKAPVDVEVENALLKRALGYSYDEIIKDAEPTGKTDENGKPIFKTHIKTITKHVAPDVLAMFFWLKNRKPDRWRDKPITIEDTSTIEKLDAMLAEVKAHAAHAETK